MTPRYYSGSELITKSTYFWTGGFKNAHTNTYTWCKRYNSTTFGAIKVFENDDHVYNNYTDTQPPLNVTQIDDYYCSAFGIKFDTGFLYCRNDGTAMSLVCESSDVADLVNMFHWFMLNPNHIKFYLTYFRWSARTVRPNVVAKNV